MKIPESVTYNTGYQQKGYEKIIDFFDSVLKENNLSLPHIDIERKNKYLWGDETHGCPLPQGAYSDEVAHMLVIKEGVVASVIETRTYSNKVHFDFFYNHKTMKSKLKEIQEWEKERKKLENWDFT